MADRLFAEEETPEATGPPSLVCRAMWTGLAKCSSDCRAFIRLGLRDFDQSLLKLAL